MTIKPSTLNVLKWIGVLITFVATAATVWATLNFKVSNNTESIVIIQEDTKVYVEKTESRIRRMEDSDLRQEIQNENISKAIERFERKIDNLNPVTPINE